jgi:hypothetical protein
MEKNYKLGEMNKFPDINNNLIWYIHIFELFLYLTLTHILIYASSHCAILYYISFLVYSRCHTFLDLLLQNPREVKVVKGP